MLRPALLTVATLASLMLRAQGAEVDYARDVKPLLHSRCFACHGALKQESGLRLDSAASILRGGDSGEAIVPGSAHESLLIERVSAKDEAERMPPEGKPLTPDQIALLTKWIDAGAKVPANDPPEEDPSAHWAFKNPVRPALPQLKDQGALTNPVDLLLAEEREARGLFSVGPLEPSLLLRRLYLDLIGLPPTRAELHAFLTDTSHNAYERAVDRLLASPHYGERWGRHWMDVWRYSDWYGRRGINDVRNSYPHIWRWRDWIVRSLNEDKGYDRMVAEMLAADEIDPGNDETVVATGYLVRSWYSMNYNAWMKDLVEHTGKAFLGLTMNCAMCHDHKYDPIKQEEYFKFRAFFEPLELRQDRVAGLPDPGPFVKYIYPESKEPIKAGIVRVFDEKPDAKTYMFSGGDERNRMKEKPPVDPAAPAFIGGDKFAIQPINLPPIAYYPGLRPAIQAEEPRQWETMIAATETELGKTKILIAELGSKLTALIAQHDSASQRKLQVAAIEPPKVALVAVGIGEGANPSKPDSQRPSTDIRKARAALEDTKLDQQILEARLANAKAQRASVEMRIKADNARYRGAGNAAELARAAKEADKPAIVLAAKEQVVMASKEVVRSKRWYDENKQIFGPYERAKKAMAKAQAALDAANKATADSEIYNYTALSPKYPERSSGRRAALARWITARDNPLTARVAANYIWLHHFGRPLVESTSNFGRNGKKPSHPKLLDYLAVELMDHGWSMKHLHKLLVTSAAYRMRSKPESLNHANLAADPDNRYYWRFNTGRMEAEVVRDSILHLAGRLDLTMGGQDIDNQQGFVVPRRSIYFTQHAEGAGRMLLMELFDAANVCDCYRRTETVIPQQALALTNSRFILDQSRVLARRLVNESSLESAPQPKSFITGAFEHILGRAPTEAEQRMAAEFLERQQRLFAGTTLIDTNADAPAMKKDKKQNAIAAATEPELRSRESFVRVLLNHNDFVTIR